MRVAEIMTSGVRTCRLTDSMNRVAQIMWEGDCGCVPVVDDEGKVVAMITDRDVCMAAYTQGRPLAEIQVSSAASAGAVTIREDDSLHVAEKLMHDHQVRRLPVVDSEGRPVGMLSLGDFARHLRQGGNGLTAHIAGALYGICHQGPPSSAAAA
jgi:CBS domain-containing protein